MTTESSDVVTLAKPPGNLNGWPLHDGATDSDFGALRHAMASDQMGGLSQNAIQSRIRATRLASPRAAATRAAASDRDAAQLPQARSASAKTSSLLVIRKRASCYERLCKSISLSKRVSSLASSTIRLDGCRSRAGSLGVVEMLYGGRGRYGFQFKPRSGTAPCVLSTSWRTWNRRFGRKNNGELP